MSLDEGSDRLCRRRGRVAGTLEWVRVTSARGVGSAGVGKTVLLCVAVVSASGVPGGAALFAEGFGVRGGSGEGCK